MYPIDLHVILFIQECELDEDFIGDNDIECELEISGAFNDIDFDCNVDADCNVQCDEEDLRARLPEDSYETVLRILEAWKPSD